MSIQDVIKKSFLAQFNSDLSTASIVMVLAVTAVLGIYLFFVYRVVCRRAFYSRSFAISLVVVSMVTSIIIITIQSSVVISLGMVGALSIVRFRTAVKDPMDLAFLFWAISVGIICGAGLYEVAIIGSLTITVVMLFLHFLPDGKQALLLVVNADDAAVEEQIHHLLRENAKSFRVRSRNLTESGFDTVIEVKLPNETEFLKKTMEIRGVLHAALLTHEGEVH